MSRGRTVFWPCSAVVFGAIGIVVGSVAGQAASSDDAQYEKLRLEREQRDRTIWADESLAQRYEETFVQLWDDLRATSDPAAVLGAFRFETLRIAEPVVVSTLDHGITVFKTDGPERDLSAADWRTLLTECTNAGMRLVQSEWHHAEFVAATDDAPATSVVNFTLHVADDARALRWDITGKLGLQWSSGQDAMMNYVVSRIDATDVTIRHREGAPGFEVAFEVRVPTYSARDDLLIYDLNGDGRSDIVNTTGNTVFWNDGDMQFRPEPLCAHPQRHVFEAVLADFTGDGQVDYLVSASNASRRSPEMRQTVFLYEGDGSGTFSQPAEGVVPLDLTLQVVEGFAVGDVDADGDLDLYLAQYRAPYGKGQFPKPYYDANDGYPGYLLINTGQGEFVDGTEGSGLEGKRHRRVFASSLVDLDADEDLDLVLTSDFAGTDVFFNDGRGRFTDVTDSAIDEPSNFGMSHAFGDFDSDGHLDFYVTGMASTTARRLAKMGLGREDLPDYQDARLRIAYGNRMYHGVGGGRFEQPAYLDSVARTGWTWACTVLDFDRDADPDIYVVNGNVSGKSAKDYCTRFWCHDIYSGSDESPDMVKLFMNDGNELDSGEMSWNGFEHNVLYMNRSGEDFDNVGFLMDVANELDSATTISDDFDLDGRPDLVLSAIDREAGARLISVMRNVLPSSNHWVGVRLSGGPGVSPIGARVLVHAGGRTQMHVVVTGDSSRCQHSMLKHFGLGSTTTIDAIEVRWPNGSVTRLEDPDHDVYHDVRPH